MLVGEIGERSSAIRGQGVRAGETAGSGGEAGDESGQETVARSNEEREKEEGGGIELKPGGVLGREEIVRAEEDESDDGEIEEREGVGP